MKLTGKARYIVINLSIASLLLCLNWYLSRYIDGIILYIGMIIGAPGFVLLILVQMLFLGKGEWEAIHNYSENIYLLLSFVSYSLIVAIVQIIIYRYKKSRPPKNNQ